MKKNLRELALFVLMMVVSVGGTFSLGYLLYVTKKSDELPPKPKYAFEMPQAPEPVHLARVENVCEPVFTEEERQRLFERCDRDGGRTSSGWYYVSCWQGDPYGTKELWKVEAKDYPEEVLHVTLPRWYTRQRLDDAALENRRLRLEVP